MRPSSPLVLAAALLLLLADAPRRASAHERDDVTILEPISDHFNPQWCPNTISRQKIQPYLASSCPTIVIPPNLCVKCKLRNHNNNGIFPNVFPNSQRDIYDTDDPGCKEELKKYVSANPCDKPRTRDIGNFLKGKSFGGFKNAKKDLGEFMYNVCELCCDCVPIGIAPPGQKSFEKQYDERKANDKWETGSNMLVDIHRGNCPVHYYYDTCRMWPDIRWIGNTRAEADKGLWRKPVCWEYVYPWWKNPAFWKNWPRAKFVAIPGDRYKGFREYLRQMMTVLSCRNKEHWVDCTAMEKAQGRV